MTRTTRYKVLYFGLVGTLVSLVLLATISGKLPWKGLTLVAVFLLVPGRLQGYYWRNFFRGRRLLGRGRAAASLPFFDEFLRDVRARPWLKTLIWLSWGIYTRDIEAMTLNNIEAAKLSVGELEGAEGSLRAALAMDPLFPLPHENLALLHSLRGEDDLATQNLARAGVLGYRKTSADRLVKAAGEVLARIEGGGAHA